MKNFIPHKEQKGTFGIPGVIVIVVIIVAVALVILLVQRQPKSYSVSINPFQLMPFVSAQEARTTICNLKKNDLFAQACQSKFDIVGKEDVKKIAELIALLDKIQNDKSIADYKKLLLAQVVFAALPIGDNPENSGSHNFYQQPLLSRLKDYLTGQITAYAQGQTMNDEGFKDLMKKDLQNMVDSLPKGDNAWVITLMVSKYSWKDGKSQPLYSHQYLESIDPFPNNPNVSTKEITYHVRSIVGSKASSQTADVGSPVYKGTSDMMAYSFTIMSWNSQEYTSKDGPVEEQFLVRRRNRSDSFYQGEHYLNNLLDAVKLPSTKRQIEGPDKKGGAYKFTIEECQKIGKKLPFFNRIWSPEYYPYESCLLSNTDENNMPIMVEQFEDANISFANFLIAYHDPEKVKELQKQDKPIVLPDHKLFKRTELDVLDGKGKAFVSTTVGEARTDGGNIITGYINSGANIYFGKCTFGFGGNSYVAWGSDRYTTYHYWEAGNEINAHPNSDHGAARLHQIIIDHVPEISEAVKDLCQ